MPACSSDFGLSVFNGARPPPKGKSEALEALLELEAGKMQQLGRLPEADPLIEVVADDSGTEKIPGIIFQGHHWRGEGWSGLAGSGGRRNPSSTDGIVQRRIRGREIVDFPRGNQFSDHAIVFGDEDRLSLLYEVQVLVQPIFKSLSRHGSHDSTVDFRGSGVKRKKATGGSPPPVA